MFFGVASFEVIRRGWYGNEEKTAKQVGRPHKKKKHQHHYKRKVKHGGTATN
jgi:hypothetical protein